MINLINEIVEKIKVNSYDYQIVNISGKAVYIYNHLGIVVFSDTQMVFKLKGKKTLMIFGEELSLIEMDKTSVLVSGIIVKTEVI